ncbi:hypothetical protein A2392_02915 [Candidatus Kaiserbacteria bacterium RIFOXYB1_FULL_46_14]|uniref:Uncharacterized protein n=1 Tax=Candidatus Kaiserbacteria bacterium RIFOXYB1_FULL_46_14 TaxID=1798531 RepID=A0A1F6FIN4_9BACT|nr:MAG: hypothetical protein A2392_02915 [Candidatus Kaiserbacteria bacterium RIFOXYB1_FULL_46_14]
MLILQSPANAGARTVAGLWKFKNGEKHDDGIDFNELCAVGSKIAAGSRGFSGNLFDIYAGLSDDGEMAFRFGYQPDESERDVSADDLQKQFADFFAQHTRAYLGFEITSDKTPKVEVKAAPLPRNNGYWNNLPLAVYSNDEDVDGNKILNAWGLKAWGRKLPSDVGDYVGWQRVGLPEGWTIGLEGHDFLLIDGFNQIRGDILAAFERPECTKLVITDEDLEAACISKEEFEAAFASDGPKKELEKPRLQLRTCISVRSAYSLADYGPYDFWVENAAGERLFGIYRQPVTNDEYDERMPKLRRRVYTWLEEHYPDWLDHNAYWEMFPQVHAQWAEAKQMAHSVAAKILEGKTDEDLKALRVEIGVGEQRTDYTLALQERLSEHFGAEPSFRVAEAVVYKIMDIFNLKIGRVDD